MVESATGCRKAHLREKKMREGHYPDRGCLAYAEYCIKIQ